MNDSPSHPAEPPPSEPVYQVRAWGGRPILWWTELLLVPLGVPLSLRNESPAARIVGGVVLVIVVGLVLFRILRGRIQLFADRIEIDSWDLPLPRSRSVVRLAEVQRMTLHRSTIRIYSRARTSQKTSIHTLPMTRLAAEEFFDRLQFADEILGRHGFRFEEQGGTRRVHRISDQDTGPA